VSNWNIFHVQAGSTFAIRALALTLGVGYSFGNDEIVRAVDFKNADESNGLVGEPTLNEVTFRRLKFLIGFQLPLS